MLKERLWAVEGVNILGGIKALEFSLVSDLVIPLKFKTLEFEKYDSIRRSMTHLTMYCQKMLEHIDNDKLLIYTF